MFQRIIGFVVTVAGVFFALLIGIWTLLSLAVVAVGATIVYAIRSRGWRRARKKSREEVIEGEFSVVDEDEPSDRHEKDSRRSSRLP